MTESAILEKFQTKDGGNLPSSANPNAGDAFLVSLTINIVLAIILVTAFGILRTRIKWLYSPRVKFAQENKLPNPPLPPDGFFEWISCLLRTSKEEMLILSGPDALNYTRFFASCCKLFVVCTMIGCILIPIHLHSRDDVEGTDNKTTLFDRLSIGYIPAGSSLFVLHAFFAWCINLFAMYFMFRLWIGFVTIRHTHLKHLALLCHPLTIFVRNIPRHLRSDRAISDYFSRLYGSNFRYATIPKDTRTLLHYLNRRMDYLHKLENSIQEWAKAGTRPFVRAGRTRAERNHWPMAKLFALPIFFFLREKVDAVTYYSHKLAKYNDFVKEEQQKTAFNRPLYGAFVTFATATSTHTAIRVEHNDRPFQLAVRLAPLPNDVYWPALWLTRKARLSRRFVVNTLVALGLVFWSVPIAFINSLSNLDRVSHTFPFLEPLVHNHLFIFSLIQGYLPSICLTVIMLIIPNLLMALCRFEGIEATSWQQRSLLNKYFLFLIFNFFIVNAIAGSLFPIIAEIASHPADLLYLLGKSIPAVAPFFINFIMLRSLTGFPLQVTRIVPMIVGIFSLHFRSLTQRIRKGIKLPPTINYGETYPEHLLIFTVGITYAVIAPIILPFVLLYFVLGYIASLNEALYIYTPSYESGGLFWPLVFRRMISSMIISQLGLLGFFALKESGAASATMLPLPFLTWLYYKYICSAYTDKGMYLPVEQAAEVDKLLAAKLEADKKEIASGSNKSKRFTPPRLSPELSDELERAEAEAEQTELVPKLVENARQYERTPIPSESNPYLQPELNAPAHIKPDIATEWAAHADEPLDSVEIPFFEDDSPRNREISEDIPLMPRSNGTPSSPFTINLYEEWYSGNNNCDEDDG